ncbi:MAG: response regulator [Geobacter sp.]|nr:MAG: response regulator [Geobacter sp.]
MTEPTKDRELWIMGLGDHPERCGSLCQYLKEGGYKARAASIKDLAGGRPLGIIIDLSPFSTDGWGILLEIKKKPETRDIPVLPLYLSEEGKVGGVFPAAGFITLPVEVDYLAEKLTVLGLTEDAEDYDLQALVISRKGEEQVARALESLGFEVVNAYTGKEGMALATTGRQYIIFCSLMLSDMAAFELVERFRLYPQTRNIPFFVMVKDSMREGERKAISRQIKHLVRKKELSRDEFLSYFRRKG